MFEVKWTGSFPTLCCGEWIIRYHGKSLKLPEDRKDQPMRTYGEYQTWHFNKDYIEEFESYYDGIREEDWIKFNKPWIKNLFDKHSTPLADSILHDFYVKIQREDFRPHSCGGCI